MKKIMAEMSSMELSGKMESTAQERSEAAKFLGRIGGKASVKSRFAGKTKKDISEIMRNVRLSKKEEKEVDVMVKKMTDNLNKNIN